MRSRQRRRWAVLAATMLALPLVAELGLRWLLFGDDRVARALGSDLRHAERFADFFHDDAYWRLRGRLEPELAALLAEFCVLDAQLGWRGPTLVAGSFEHVAEALLGDRRPVLMFGASFVTPDYTTLVLASERGATHGLLTYGAGGHGAGQSSLVLREALPRFAGRAPLVLFCLCVDSDLSRARLGLREARKPRFSLDAAGSVIAEPFEAASLATVVASEPVAIDSYLWAWLTGLSSPLPPLRAAAERRRSEHDRADLAVNRALIAGASDNAEALGAEFAVVLFHSAPALWVEPSELERRLIEALEADGVEYLDSRLLFDAARDAGEALGDLYHPPEHRSANHPNARGRELLARLLLRAIDGGRDRSDANRNPYSALIGNLARGADGAAPVGGAR